MTTKQWMPEVLKQYHPGSSIYGPKGVGHPHEANGLGAGPDNGFWGLEPDWWYNWGADAWALEDPNYVPMIWCPADAGGSFTPAKAADLARRYPGRVWLAFNEPDLIGQCGSAISRKFSYFDDHNWAGLGAYLADQYIFYRDAIRDADPHARVFGIGLTQLPMPGLKFTYFYWPTYPYPEEWVDRAIKIWNGFTGRLAARNCPLDGITVHAYAGGTFSSFHDGCKCGDDSWTDYACVQEALSCAHRFFQGTDGYPSRNAHPEVTAGKPIWITEIGVLRGVNTYPGYSWIDVRDNFMVPMQAWINDHAGPGGDCQHISAVAWFSTHYKTGLIDNTASDLLDHSRPQNLTPLGASWRDWTCFTKD